MKIINVSIKLRRYQCDSAYPAKRMNRVDATFSNSNEMLLMYKILSESAVRKFSFMQYTSPNFQEGRIKKKLIFYF